jgi:hypothetical protein
VGILSVVQDLGVGLKSTAKTFNLKDTVHFETSPDSGALINLRNYFLSSNKPHLTRQQQSLLAAARSCLHGNCVGRYSCAMRLYFIRHGETVDNVAGL